MELEITQIFLRFNFKQNAQINTLELILFLKSSNNSQEKQSYFTCEALNMHT